MSPGAIRKQNPSNSLVTVTGIVEYGKPSVWEYGKPSMGCFLLPSVGSQVVSFIACLREAVQPSAVQHCRAL